MVAFLFRRQSAQVLLTLRIGLLAIASLIRIVFFILPSLLGAGGADPGPSPEQLIADDLVAFRGPWIEQFRMRAAYTFEGQTSGWP